MLSLRKLLHAMLVCGLIPLTLWSGVPRSGCLCAAAPGGCPCCAAAPADSGMSGNGDCCNSSCCSHSAEKTATGEESDDPVVAARHDNRAPLGVALRPSSCEICRCASKPADWSSQTTDVRGGFQTVAWADCEASPHVALKSAASAGATQLPSSAELPPLDRLIAFCVLLV